MCGEVKIGVPLPVIIQIRSEEHQVQAGMTLKEALEQLSFSIETHMALRAGKLLTASDQLEEGDIVRLIPVISGG
jgi:sulfur carrier protein